MNEDFEETKEEEIVRRIDTFSNINEEKGTQNGISFMNPTSKRMIQSDIKSQDYDQTDLLLQARMIN